MTAALVSVVIPTFRRTELLQRCLRAVLAQEFHRGPYEVIVADDGHDDTTRDAVEALWLELPPRVVLHYVRPGRGRGPAVARNAGWRATRSPIVAFTDDDTVPDPGWLAAGWALLAARPDWCAAAGTVRVPLAGKRPTDHERMTQGLETAEFVTANAFVRRSALEKVGGFDEQFLRAWREDSDLQFRLSLEAGTVGRAPDAVVVHPVRPERWGVSLRQQRNVVFDALLYKKHPALYRARIQASPAWNYYTIVGATLLAPLFAVAGAGTAAAACAALAIGLVAHFAWRRLRGASWRPAHVAEMVATSALIPFLSVYWRLRGAWHFRVLFW